MKPRVGIGLLRKPLKVGRMHLCRVHLGSLSPMQRSPRQQDAASAFDSIEPNFRLKIQVVSFTASPDFVDRIQTVPRDASSLSDAH